eukprot:TRINITY_DN8816_c0_g1_i1.p1 TRINITY_DN8816_c0_g1~~TRINITY_DN8816_c0_g1_i1.p1  ORF type:complete len:212 (-),score=58.02 TRINITY_DN8816_c0_g1_i1:25-639(-)
MATDKMKELKTLIAEKDEMELQIKQLIEYLEKDGIGLNGSLVDADGFPLDDVNRVLSVRDARNKIARLQNDHKTIMKEIEHKMIDLHSTSRQSQPKSKLPVINNIQEDVVIDETEKPVFLVDEVSNDSPAQHAGLLVGDKIISFGPVKDTLKNVGELVQNSENRPISVRLHRTEDGNRKAKVVSITPKKWNGRGLLGCHLVPIK